MGFERFVSKFDPEAELNKRSKLSVAEYEDIVNLNDSLGIGNTEKFDANDWNLKGDFLYLGNKNHIRQYSGF
jgi:3-hydroxy-3-methylglutaryl CoA synthase